MAISGKQTIRVGLPNESANSDSLYTAFNKINDNFTILFGNSSNVIAGNGITITNNASNTVISTNLVAGNNIVLTTANSGAITIESIGGGGGNSTLTGVLAGNGLTGGGYSGNVSLALSNSNVSAGNYTNPTITVDQYGRIVAASNNTVAGTVTSVGISPGAGIQVSGTNPVTTNGFITVTNTGVTSLSAGPGISLSSSNGAVTITASGGGGGGGVTSVGITSTTGLVITNSPIISSGSIGVNLPSNLSITGNITAGGRFIGNGSGLTGITVAAANVTGLGNVALANFDGNASNVLHGDGTWSADVTNYGNSNVAAYLPTYTGNLNAGNASLGNAVTANYFIGNFYGTANAATTATTAGTVTTAAQPNITSVGTLASLTVTANTTTGGIKTDNYYYANGVSISFAGSYSNSNVAAYLPTYAGNITAGNVYANSGIIGAQTLKGEGGNISNVTAGNITGQVSNALVAGTVYTAAQPNITSVGTLTSLGVSGNITAANITANTGVFSGNGSALSSLTFGNITTISTSGLTTDEIYLQAGTRLDVTANGASGYLFDQYGSGNNPALYVESGQTLAFNLNIGGHPFLIQTSGGANYSTGLTHVATTGTVSNGASAQGQTAGTLYWKVPYGITGNYKYQCSAHGAMNGNIVITDANVSNISVASATTAGTITTAAQPNITSVGTLTSLAVTGNIGANNVLLDGYVKTEAVTFSLLPAAGTAGAGARAFITDGNLAMAGNFGSLVTGGAGNAVPVVSDGTNWRIG